MNFGLEFLPPEEPPSGQPPGLACRCRMPPQNQPMAERHRDGRLMSAAAEPACRREADAAGGGAPQRRHGWAQLCAMHARCKRQKSWNAENIQPAGLSRWGWARERVLCRAGASAGDGCRGCCSRVLAGDWAERFGIFWILGLGGRCCGAWLQDGGGWEGVARQAACRRA